jgi:hypothetical protein
MVCDLSELGAVRVTKQGYVEELLTSTSVTGGARTPATEGLFEKWEGTQRVGEAEQRRFHRAVARLLPFGKRTRLDILTAVAYLATTSRDSRGC